MKLISLSSIALMALISQNALSQNVKILFLGNSYTTVNYLPSLVYGIGTANGKNLLIDSYSPGGYTFQGHSNDATAIAKIYSQQWDFVVLQEQSQLPSFPPSQVASQVYPYAAILDSLIHDNNPCTETVFYMTWGRKNGDATNCPNYAPLCTYEGMQARLRESYLQMGLLNHASVAPVGAAWRYMRTLNPLFDLYDVDESHPSLYGSYLAACVIYSTIFGESSVGSTFISGLPANDALTLQTTSDAVAIDSIFTWYANGDIPFASFSYSSTGTNVQFQNHSLNSMSYHWDFGDGLTSTNANPSHVYSVGGNYQVELIALSNNGCMADTLIIPISTNTTSVDDLNQGYYLNLSSDAIYFYNDGNYEKMAIYDQNGRVLQINHNLVRGENMFPIENISSGIYLMRLTGSKSSLNIKWFK